jgi:hypothetical protein
MVDNSDDHLEHSERIEVAAILALCCILYSKEVVARSGSTCSRSVVSGRQRGICGVRSARGREPLLVKKLKGRWGISSGAGADHDKTKGGKKWH